MTYPKDGERRLRETIRQLKTENGRLRKELSILQNQVDKQAKPESPRKLDPEPPKPEGNPKEQWRDDFLKSVRPTIEKRIKERK